MRCDSQTLFIVVVGVATSQYFVWQFARMQACLTYFDRTLREVWRRYYKDYSCSNYDLWQQNSSERLRLRLEKDKKDLVWLFYLWNLMWVAMLCFCLPRVWALPVVSVLAIYGLIVVSVSFMAYRGMSVYLEVHPELCVPANLFASS